MAFPFSLKYTVKITNSLGLSGTAYAIPANVNNLLMINLLGIFLVFLGIGLVLASRDIENRAWFILWEGVLRLLVFPVNTYFVFARDACQLLFVIGIIDLVFGTAYLWFIFTIPGLKKY